MWAAYKSLAEQLTNEGYQVIRFETKIIANRNMTLEELLNKIVDVLMKFKVKQENTQFILLVIVLHVIFYYCYKKR